MVATLLLISLLFRFTFSNLMITGWTRRMNLRRPVRISLQIFGVKFSTEFQVSLFLVGPVLALGIEMPILAHECN